MCIRDSYTHSDNSFFTNNKLFPSSFVRLCISVIVAIISVGLSALYIGMTQREREVILEKVNSVVNRLKK